jgi:hypothetical protein
MTVSPLDSEFDRAPAIAAAAHWVDPALRQVALSASAWCRKTTILPPSSNRRLR